MTSEVDLVARVAETLDLGGWSVTVEKPLDGIQVDAYVTRPGEAAIVVECKAYRNLVGLRTARGFASVVDYLREGTPAIRGWLVTTTGFTQNAADALRRHGVEGYTLSELQQRIRPIQPNVLKQSPIWTEEIANAKKQKKRVFAIMPFSDAMLDVFILGSRWAASELDAVAERADDLQHNGEMRPSGCVGCGRACLTTLICGGCPSVASVLIGRWLWLRDTRQPIAVERASPVAP